MLGLHILLPPVLKYEIVSLFNPLVLLLSGEERGHPRFWLKLYVPGLPKCPYSLFMELHAMLFLPGACLAAEKNLRGVCSAGKRVWLSQGCPSKIGILVVVLLGLYIIAYAPGMVTVPWVLNSEIYPLRYKGLGGGIAAVSNWCANLIMTDTFLLFAGFSLVAIVAIYLLVPETKVIQLEEVEKLLQDGFRPFPSDKKNNEMKKKEDDTK
ncbi:hypothetical protein JHK87_053017 [Glycine soja]|nr:hypothetical protein JHK87_053017 [Glycine soja]